MRRRTIFAVFLTPIVVLGVQVQLARSGTRLADEVGFRPVDASVRDGADPLRVVWLGDSTATGVGVDRIEATMAWRVAEAATEGAVELTVLGRSGDQVHEVLDDQLPRLADADADLVLVAVGANDVTALTRVPTFRARYRELLTGLQGAAPAATIVVLGVPDLGVVPRLLPPLRQLAGVRAAQLDRVIEELAEESGVRYVEMADTTGPVFGSDPDRYFAADDYHPSGEGYRVWAEVVLASVAP